MGFSLLILIGCALETTDTRLLPGADQLTSRVAVYAPGNLRITAFTSYSVSLAWSPVSGSGITYRVRHSWGYERSTTGTELTWTGNLEPRSTYSFYVYAVDGRGIKSKPSNTVTVRLPADTVIPPSTPILRATAIGPSYVSLEWSSTDDGPFIWYYVFKDGSPILFATGDVSATIGLLTPGTRYSFAVQARDQGNNYSSLSEPLIVTTLASDPTDTTPPTVPGNLEDNGMSFPDGETWLFWTESTDNEDPQDAIRYDIYVNGAFDHSLAGQGRTIVYGEPGALNTYEVVAVDAAGNRSSPATLATRAG